MVESEQEELETCLDLRTFAGDGLMLCGAPNTGTEMRCQREAGHQNECWSKYWMLYPSGIISSGEMSWNGPNNLPREAENDDGMA